MQFCTLRVRIDYKTIVISKILCYNICACQAAYLGKGGLYHPAMKPSGPLQPRLRTASSSAGWTRPCGKSPATPCAPKIHIVQQDGDYYNVMPCIYERGNIAMVKMIGRHSIKRGEDRSSMMGDILVYESDTGILRALMDGEYITTLRTGISAAHSARLFTRPDFETVGLIGLGNIMTVCIRAFIASLRAEGDRRDVTLKLIRYHGHQQRIMDLFREDPNVHFVLCDTYEEVIGGSDLVISAITKVTENFVTDEYFKEGCTVIPICTMGFQNCDLFFDRVFTDEMEQIRGFKYFDHFAPVTTNVTDVLNGAAPGRTDNVQRILVYNYGIAIHDLVFAANIYGRAAVPDTPYRYCREKYFIRRM